MSALLREFFGSVGIPVVRNIPFGHRGDNLLMPVGARVRLSTAENSFTITEPAVGALTENEWQYSKRPPAKTR